MTRSACPLPAGSRVWAYLRVSGDEQADRGLPIAGQRQRAQEYADTHGLIISRWFVDEAKSAGSTVGRDAFNDMIYLSRQQPREERDAQQPQQVAGILVWDLKRFARNLLDSQFYKADLRRRGYTLVFLSDDIPETDFAPVYEALLEWKAQKDRGDIAKDSQRGLQTLARLGYAPGGFPPRGYIAEVLTVELEGKKRQVRRWIPDPQWWDRARQAWQMRAEGRSLSDIVQVTGIFPSQNCLTAFFANRTYLGIRKCGDLEIPNAHEPLVTLDVWDAVQKQRRRRAPGGAWLNHPRRVNSRYLLSGLLYCAECGSAMCGSASPARHMADGNRAEWRFYICGRKTRQHTAACPSSRIKADIIEDAVLQTITEDILTEAHLAQLLENTNAALAGQQHDLTERQERLQYAVRQQERLIANLVDAVEQGQSQSVGERLRQREQERDKFLTELAEVREAMQRSRLEISPAALRHLCDNLHEVLKSSDPLQVRRLLRRIIVRIEATKRGGLLYYTFPAWTGVPPGPF